MMGRFFSDNTKELLRTRATGQSPSMESRLKMAESNGGVTVFVYSLDFSQKTASKKAAADSLGISVRTLGRRLKEGKPLINGDSQVIVSLNPIYARCYRGRIVGAVFSLAK